MDKRTIYTVWVGGTEVNDYYLNESKAHALAQQFKNDGYNDVIIEKIATLCDEIN